MAQLQPEGTPNETVSNITPTLELWLKQEKITQNLYSKLTSQEPKYTVELLLFMSQNDVKELKKDITGIKMQEILQLISEIAKIPQSQIHREMNTNIKVVYLTPKQHDTISQLKQNLKNISQRLDNITDVCEQHTTQYNKDIFLVASTFEKTIKMLNKQKELLIGQIKSIHQNKTKLLHEKKIEFQQLYSSSLNIKNQFETFTQSIPHLSTKQSIQRANDIQLVIDQKKQELQMQFALLDKLMGELCVNFDNESKQQNNNGNHNNGSRKIS